MVSRTAFRVVGAFAMLACSPIGAVDAGAEHGIDAGTTIDADGGTPTSGTGAVVDADRLGDARLFFTRGERAPGGKGLASAAPVPRPSDGVDVPGKGSGRSAAAAERPSSPRPVHPRFQAVLRVGTRVRVIVGDRPCRAHGAANGLDCVGLPDGIRALSLDPDGRRLLATLDDGRRKRFFLGEEVRP